MVTSLATGKIMVVEFIDALGVRAGTRAKLAQRECLRFLSPWVSDELAIKLRQENNDVFETLRVPRLQTIRVATNVGYPAVSQDKIP